MFRKTTCQKLASYCSLALLCSDGSIKILLILPQCNKVLIFCKKDELFEKSILKVSKATYINCSLTVEEKIPVHICSNFES